MLIVALASAACGPDQVGAPPQNPLHLDEHLADAVFEGAAMSMDVPAPVEWGFDDAQQDWRPARPWNPTIGAPKLALIGEALRVTLTEDTRNPNGLPRGGIYVDVPDWTLEDWGHIEIRARTSEPMQFLGAALNLRAGTGTSTDGIWPFEFFAGSGADVVGDGAIQTYLLRLDSPFIQRAWTGPLRQLGLWLGAREPASIDILSIRAIPTEAPFAAAPVGVQTVGAPELPALYIRAPGRIEYRLEVPTEGRFDVALGVLRDDTPVTFRITASDDQGETSTLLEESLSDRRRWVQRSIDLAHLAGETVRLTLEAEADRAGTIALFRAPVLYTPSRLSTTIVDAATGEPTPVRVRLTDADGAIAPLPEAAIGVLYGPNDVAAGFGFQRDSSFYVDGSFDVELQPGTYRLSVSKGYEYLRQNEEFVLEPGEELAETISLQRWIDMPSRGWFSGDDHIHLRRSPRENPLILKWIAAEDIHVGALLQMGDFWATYFAQYAWGRDGVYQLEDFLLTSGQEEPRTHEIGHTISLGADDFVRFRGDYYYYDRVFDQVHELGGLTGYAHHGIGFHGYRGLTLDVLRHKVDFLEILQFGQMHLEHYYHFLDLGFELTAMAGSDFPWSGQIGDVRFYTYVGDELTFDGWRENLRAGHTFVSNGPVLELEVNGKIPGDRLDVTSGSTLSITARALGHETEVPLSDLEIVAHGEVIERITAEGQGQSPAELRIELELPAERGIWIAGRANAGEGQVAHTTPVYVTVDGSGFHNPATALGYLDLNERYLDELEQEISQRNETLNQLAWRYREGLQARIQETREIIAKLRADFQSKS